MASIIKCLMASKKIIERGHYNFKKSPKDRLSKDSYLKIRLDNLEQEWTIIKENHLKLSAEATEAILKDDYFESNVYESIEETYISYKLDIKEALNLVCQSQPKSSICTKVQKAECSVRLPKITIPTFSGLYAEWPTFRDLYVSLIHKNESLDNVQKMHYLKGHLSGEAEQLLRHVPITAANYSESWSILNSRYNNKKFLANCLLSRFMSQPSIGIESCSAIKDMLDITNDTLNGLKNLDIDVDSWDVIVVYIICSKLDSESRKLWEAKISTSDELPTLRQMKEFLESRFRSLEFLDTKSKPKISTQKPKVLHAITSDSNAESHQCPYCKKGDHKMWSCKEFMNVDYDTRYNFVQNSGLCFNCLGRNHSANACRSSTKCRVCKRNHHSLIHPTPSAESHTSSLAKPEEELEVNTTVSNVVNVASDNTATTSNVSAHFSKQTRPNQILLATAVIKTSARNGSAQFLRALLDQGSQASFVTESTVQLLGLKKIPNNSVISGLGGGKGNLASKHMVVITVQSRHDPSFQLEVRAHVLSAITSLLPSEKIKYVDWPELEEIALADPHFTDPNKIDILLGADVYGQVLRDGMVKAPNSLLTAQHTALGWILSGPVYQDDSPESLATRCHHNTIRSMHAHVDDNELLKQFWQIESDSFETKMLSPAEQFCEEFYSQTTKRDSTGRYVVRLPFSDVDPQCKYGNSRQIALKRFHLLEHRFKKNPEIKARYSEVMQEYLDLGHMERLASTDKQSEGVYLPHHAVIREDKTTTKVRVVFDASCRGTNGVSLNDNLIVGPTLQQDLRHIMMRWRTHPICLSADIVKMYRQVVVDSEDAEFQRLLWRNDPTSEIQDLRLVRVTFGTASAPYLAVKTLQQLATDEGADVPEIARRVKTDFYVDDLLTGCQTVEEGTRIYTEMKNLLSKGGFDLQKWITNNKELAEVIMDRQENQEGKVEIKMNEVVKVLGLTWDKESDSFHYSVQLPVLQIPVTKRRVISDISRLFDPLGWVAPCVIVAKVMIQKLWLAGIGWDEELPEELLQEWLTYRSDLVRVREVSVPRWVQVTNDSVGKEIHGFCDASSTAYAAAVYLRTMDALGNVHVNLIAAKTKVAPTMQVSIPRLELMGAVLVTKLINEVAGVLNVDSANIHGWTDSTVVLSWLSSHPSRWTTFIANRTSEILTKLDNTHWSHVESNQNPADVASRGCTPDQLIENAMWLQGPSWLKESTIEYKRPKSISTELEQRKVKVLLSVDTTTVDPPIWTKFSSLQRLIRVVALCRRFLRIKEVNMKFHKFQPFIESSELKEAIECCIKQCQSLESKDDLKRLKPLNPYNDEKGILRARGRIQNSNLPEDVKHPIILPHKSHLTDLIIDDAHKKTLHGGPQLMLTYLRSKYWIVSAKTLVRKHVHKCVICVRYAATIKPQFMGQLPPARVTPARAFLHSGVDFAGPINLRISKGRGNRSYKGYICLFVCMVSKAIHLEAVSDLTAQGFIAGFKRFVARRGHVSEIWSDNGTNFVGASKELQDMVNVEQSSVAIEIREWLSNNNVTWHFIPPHGPTFGGLWESGVKSTKFHLKRVIEDSTLTFEEMTTVLSQIEACLNSRPLSMLPNQTDDVSPLTPGHFLIGEPLIVVPDRCYEHSNISSLRRWQLIQKMTQDFWRRWSNEYLVHCLQRYKWTKVNPEPKVGDVVLVKEDNLPPARWLLGKVVKQHPGLDGMTRVVTLKCNKSLIKRPTSKLCILPVTD